MSRRPLPRLTLLALGLCATALSPVAAQSTPPADIPIIDLGPVLDAPQGGTVPSGDITRTPTGVPETFTLIPDAELTVPQYERAGGPGPAPDAEANALLLPLRADRPNARGITRLSGEVQSAGFFVDLPSGATASDLVIAYRIAINVLPEKSQLRIAVNGVALEPVRPTAFEGFEPLRLPADLLIEGRNRITIEVRHSHRIFCGPDATFAVWTEIDTNASGARLTAQDLGLDAPSLALAVRAQLALTGSLPVRIANPEDSEILGGFGARLAALRDGAPVVLSPEPAYGANPARPDRARITVLGDGPPLAEVRRGADGALVLVLSGGDTGQLPDIDALLPQPDPVVGNPVLDPGVATTLASLSDGPLETHNRYAELPVVFRMPDDWLTLASQKAVLRLSYGFADGLPEGALMLVKINETTVRLLPLDRDSTRARPPLDVGFPARLLRPGVNALTFVAIVPGDPVDLPCPPILAPLLTIDLASTLEVPPSPRMVVPGMAAALRAVRPDQIVPPDAEQAFTVAQKDTLAVLGSTLRPILGIERLAEARLTVAPVANTGALTLDRLGLARRDLDRLLAVPITGVATSAGAPSLGQRARSFADKLRQLAVPGDPPLSVWLAGRQAQAVLLTPDPAKPDDLWLVLAGDTDPLSLAPILAQARLAPDGPAGQLSILTRDGTWQSWHDRARPPVLSEPLSRANFREVVGNYASWSPLYFGLVLFALTLVSVTLALIFVITTRGRRKK